MKIYLVIALCICVFLMPSLVSGQAFRRVMEKRNMNKGSQHLSYDGHYWADLVDGRIVTVYDREADTILRIHSETKSTIRQLVMIGSSAVVLDSARNIIMINLNGDRDTIVSYSTDTVSTFLWIGRVGADKLFHIRAYTINNHPPYIDYRETLVFDSTLRRYPVYNLAGLGEMALRDMSSYDGISLISRVGRTLECGEREPRTEFNIYVRDVFRDSLRLWRQYDENVFPEWTTSIALTPTKLFARGRIFNVLDGSTSMCSWSNKWKELCSVSATEIVYVERISANNAVLGLYNIENQQLEVLDTIADQLHGDEPITAESLDHGRSLLVTQVGQGRQVLYNRPADAMMHDSLVARVRRYGDVNGSKIQLDIVSNGAIVPHKASWFINGEWTSMNSAGIVVRLARSEKQRITAEVRLINGDTLFVDGGYIDVSSPVGVIRSLIPDATRPFDRLLSVQTSFRANVIHCSQVNTGRFVDSVLYHELPAQRFYPDFRIPPYVVTGSVCGNGNPLLQIIVSSAPSQADTVLHAIGFSVDSLNLRTRMIAKAGVCSVLLCGDWLGGNTRRHCNHLRSFLKHSEHKNTGLHYVISSDYYDAPPYDAVVRTWLMRIDRDTGLTNPYGHYAPGTLKNPGRMYRSIHVGSRDKGVVTHDSGFIVIDVASGAFVDSAIVVGLKDAVIDRQGRIHTPQGVYQRDVQTWRHERTLPFSDGIGTLMIADTAVAVIRASQDSMIYVYDIRTNDVLAFRGRYPGQASSWAFAEGANVIVIGTDEGMVHCLRLDEIAGSNVPVDYGDDDDKPGYVYHDEETLEEYSVMRFTSPLRRVELYTTLGALLQRQDVDGVREFRLDAIRDIPSGPVFVVFRTDAGTITHRLLWVR